VWIVAVCGVQKALMLNPRCEKPRPNRQRLAGVSSVDSVVLEELCLTPETGLLWPCRLNRAKLALAVAVK
jgi:hypothetical protein